MMVTAGRTAHGCETAHTPVPRTYYPPQKPALFFAPPGICRSHRWSMLDVSFVHFVAARIDQIMEGVVHGPALGGFFSGERNAAPLRRPSTASLLQVVHSLLDSLMQLVKLRKTVQTRASEANIPDLQLPWTATSSGRCGEAGPEKAVVATRACC